MPSRAGLERRVGHEPLGEERLIEMYPGLLRYLRLLALDPYDLVLTKLTRHADRDRGDLAYLATAVPLGPNVLRERYQREMRSYVAFPAREDLTLDLWIEIVQETQGLRSPNRRDQIG